MSTVSYWIEKEVKQAEVIRPFKDSPRTYNQWNIYREGPHSRRKMALAFSEPSAKQIVIFNMIRDRNLGLEVTYDGTGIA